MTWAEVSCFYDPLLLIKITYVISIHKHGAYIVSILGGEVKEIIEIATLTLQLFNTYYCKYFK